jgi:hypothetical protein
MTLFFVLSQNSLEVYGGQYHFEKLVFSLDSDTKVLQLHDKFAAIWQQLYDNYIVKTSQIQLILKSKASFTDTRIISIWCRSHCMFDASVIFEVMTQEQFEDQNQSAKTQIIYSQAPKIGVKVLHVT